MFSKNFIAKAAATSSVITMQALKLQRQRKLVASMASHGRSFRTSASNFAEAQKSEEEKASTPTQAPAQAPPVKPAETKQAAAPAASAIMEQAQKELAGPLTVIGRKWWFAIDPNMSLFTEKMDTKVCVTLMNPQTKQCVDRVMYKGIARGYGIKPELGFRVYMGVVIPNDTPKIAQLPSDLTLDTAKTSFDINIGTFTLTCLRIKELDSSVYLWGFANIQLGLGFTIIKQANLKALDLALAETTVSEGAKAQQGEKVEGAAAAAAAAAATTPLKTTALVHESKITPKNNWMALLYAVLILGAKAVVIGLLFTLLGVAMIPILLLFGVDPKELQRQNQYNTYGGNNSRNQW